MKDLKPTTAAIVPPTMEEMARDELTTARVFRAIVDNALKGNGSYRSLHYDRLKMGDSNYVTMIAAGGGIIAKHLDLTKLDDSKPFVDSVRVPVEITRNMRVALRLVLSGVTPISDEGDLDKVIDSLWACVIAASGRVPPT